MTDGAARTLIARAGAARRAVPRLTLPRSRARWTSGQWMTERTGGSDVAISETVATRDAARAGASTAQVVQLGDDLADGAHARAPRGQSARRQRARALLRARSRDAAGSPNASWSTGSRRSSARAWCRPPSSRSTATLAIPVARPERRHQEHHADAQHHAHVERHRRRLACATASRSRATTRTGASRSARRSPRSRCTSRRSRRSQAEYEAAFLLTFRAVELLGRDEAGELDEPGRPCCACSRPS